MYYDSVLHLKKCMVINAFQPKFCWWNPTSTSFASTGGFKTLSKCSWIISNKSTQTGIFILVPKKIVVLRVVAILKSVASKMSKWDGAFDSFLHHFHLPNILTSQRPSAPFQRFSYLILHFYTSHIIDYHFLICEQRELCTKGCCHQISQANTTSQF